MARWEFAISLDRHRGVPLVQQIARAVSDDIRRGRLRPGDPLPGTRTLARSLGVQRLTVVSAFDELLAEGWIVTRPARGTFVSPALPDDRPRGFARPGYERRGVPERVAFDLPPAPPGEMPYEVPKGALLFAPNRPDVRLIPHDVIGRAYRRAVRRGGAVLLSYGRPQGHERLRAAIAGMLSASRGIAASADDVCITRGSQMGLALLARAILRPGDVVAMEELSHRPALEVFRMQGATVVPIPVDGEGLKVDALERLADRGGLRAVHVTPHHQFPTTVMLSAARRMRLLDLARTRRFAVIEEDYDHEFHYDGRPVLPLASADRWGVVAYVGSFSKVLAPALRIGYVVAPPPLLASVAAHRMHVDVQGDRVLEYALAELVEDGEVQRHIRRVRREYAARREVLAQALRRRLGDALRFTLPAGGIGLWVEAARGIDIDLWARRAEARGAVIATAAGFAVDGRPRPFARLGFASLDRGELAEGVRRLAAACPR
jgi:GntR family transcriptional regulator/MocR family aminotransferase